MSEAEKLTRPDPAGLFGRQILGILRFELRRNLFSRRAWGVYFLAFMPVLLVALWSVTPLPGEMFEGPAQTVTFFAVIFSFYLRVSIFLSALFLFMSLFRSEILERSLHYYFLTPVRREVLVAGKYLSALLSSWVIFTISTVALYLLIGLPWGLGELGHYLFRGPGLGNMTAYVATALLGVAGYGAVFLLAGMFFRNPVVPAVLIWFWEMVLHPFLPATLKKISVAFYLQSFYPVIPPEEGCLALFQVLEEPPPVWLSVFGLLIFTVVVLFAAGWRARTMEVAYGDD